MTRPLPSIILLDVHKLVDFLFSHMNLDHDETWGDRWDHEDTVKAIRKLEAPLDEVLADIRKNSP